jgi:iduronate 2-sulfatase
MMAGRHPDQLGIRDLWTRLRDVQPDVVSLPGYFKERGYRTLSFGKVYHHANDDQASWTDRPPRPGGMYASPEIRQSIARRTHEAKAEGLTGVELFERTRGPAFEAAEVSDNEYPDGKVARQAVDALAAMGDDPFFMCVGFAKPHLPFNAPRAYWDYYREEDFEVPTRQIPTDAPAIAFTNWNELRAYQGIPGEGVLNDDLTRKLRHAYAACVSYADAQVGRVLAQLEKAGLRDDTIIILWGDHGYKLGEHGLWCKHTNLELDTRVPLIIAGHDLPQQQRTFALTEIIDLFPTLAALTDGEIPGEIQGRSLVPVLRDPARPFRQAALSQYPRGETTGYSLRTERWRYTEWIDSTTGRITNRELYDHGTHPVATANLAGDPAFADLVASLSLHLQNTRHPVARR